MSTDITIYHNPRCSKSRQTLELLQQQGIEPNIRLYLKDSLSELELKTLLNKLGITARALMRHKEVEFKQLGLEDQSLSEQTLIDAMISTPKLMERPIVEVENKAAIGRPPEQVLALFL
jgi:arsenate reductase (glutaredoxin)